MHVISSVTGRTGNWAYMRRMEFEAVPRVGDQIVWGKTGHEVVDTVKRVYFYEQRLHSSTVAGVAIELEHTRTDSPDILNELMELHSDWEQHGGPWKGQE